MTTALGHATGSAVATLAVIIEFVGTLVVAFGCLRGFGALATGRGRSSAIRGVRLVVADAIIAGLGFKTAATLLKTLELQTWRATAMFTAIFALRTLVKRALLWEERRLRDQAS